MMSHKVIVVFAALIAMAGLIAARQQSEEPLVIDERTIQLYGIGGTVCKAVQKACDFLPGTGWVGGLACTIAKLACKMTGNGN